MINGVAPTVSGVASTNANGTYGAGAVISLQVAFSEPVDVTGTPQLTLNTAPSAVVNYTSGSGTSTLTFTYTVVPGQTTSGAKLDATALSLNGGTIRDSASNNAVLTLPTPGGAGSLSAGANIIIQAVAPTAQNLFVTNTQPGTVSEVTSGGGVSTFAAGFSGPYGLAFDGSGNLYIANGGAGTVSEVTPAGGISTFATGFSEPAGLAFDGSGNLYVANAGNGNGTVSKVTPGGGVSTFAAGFSGPNGLAFDSSGNLYVSNFGTGTVSEVAPAGVVTTFATGFLHPQGLAFDGSGNLYVANEGNGAVSVVRKVTPAGVVTTFATGFIFPIGLAFDSSGNLYVGNDAAGNQVVIKVTPAGVLTTFATGLDQPYGLAFAPELTISTAHVGTSFVQGQQGAQYVITVMNNAVTATTGTIAVSDILPTGLTFVSGSGAGWNCSASGHVVTCTDATAPIPASTTSSITLSVNVAGNSPFTESNSASVACTCTEIKINNNTSNTDMVNVTQSPTITKAFSPTAIPSGGSSLVTLTLSNSNRFALTDGAFTDTLANMSAVAGAVGGTCAGTTPASLIAGQTSLSFSGITIPANGNCTVAFSVTSIAAGGNNNTTSGVTTDQTPTAGTGSNTAALTVLVTAIIQVNPNAGQQGQNNEPVTITGQYTHWVQGTTTASFGAGVSVVSLTVNSATSAIAVLSIDPAAAVGPRDITLTTGTEVATALSAFTVNTGSLMILSVSPNTGIIGQQNLTVTITALFTHFAQGHTAVDFGADITVVSVTVNSPTSLTAVIDIGPGASYGPCTVTVSTHSNPEVVTLDGGFFVRAAGNAPVAGAPFQVGYAANLDKGESWINIVNTGANGAALLGPGFGGPVGNLCVNVYVSTPDEELISCCSCLVTPDQVVSLGVNRDILPNNTHSGQIITSVTVELLATLAGDTGTGASCSQSAAAATAASVVGGFVAFGTTQHTVAGNALYGTEVPFIPASLSTGELTSLGNRCTAIIGNLSGYGVCAACRPGALGAAKQQ